MAVRYVLDASAGVDILQRTSDGRTLASIIRDEDEQTELWTVEHFHLEVAKVFRRDVLAGVTDDATAIELVDLLAEWSLATVSVAPLLTKAWTLRNNLTIHDALYVVLTRRLESASLVSTDRKLTNAPGVDVPVITPDQLPG